MLYLLYKFASWISRTFSISVCYNVAEKVALLYYVFASNTRKLLMYNLRIVLGEDVSEHILKEHVRNIFMNFGRYLADFFRSSILTDEEILSNIDMRHLEYVDKCLKSGKGVILLTAHLGNWELGAAALAARGYPISAIVLEHSDHKVNDFFEEHRHIRNVHSIPIGTQLRKCFKVLKRNEILAIAGDKDYTGNGVEVDFFGKKAVMPKGAAVLSCKTGAPIIVCSLVQDTKFSFVMDFDEPIFPSGDDPEYTFRKCMRHFEKHIKEYPDQWYAFRTIWQNNTKIS